MEPIRIATFDEPQDRPNRPLRRLLRRKSRVSPMLRLGLVAACVVGLCLGYLALRARQAELLHRLALAEKRLDALKTANRRLEGSITAAFDLSRIEYLARTELGMVDGDQVKVLEVAAAPRGGRAAGPAYGQGQPDPVRGGSEGGMLARLLRWFGRWIPGGGPAYAERLTD